MDDRFAELEVHLRAWERRNRLRTLLLVLVPLSRPRLWPTTATRGWRESRRRSAPASPA